MLFNSYSFIFVFLPIVVLGLIWLRQRGHSAAVKCWLILASFVFYGWWKLEYVPLLIGYIAFNYLVGRGLMMPGVPSRQRDALVIAGVIANLSVLGYFKYAYFFTTNLDVILGTDFSIERIALPLAISFITFQKIAYLLDVRRGTIKSASLLDYTLFVTFFPQLIAGPIVLFQEIVPQFARTFARRYDWRDLDIGLTIFVIGLFKKVMIADTMAGWATPVFNAASAHEPVMTFFDAWGGVLAYTFQIYFDFSGYSDMAIGLARMCGLKLPVNFASPYAANNIIEFWRRWHITLSRFLRDHLYIALGGNRFGPRRQYLNIMITMLLGGLWHGANWTFVAWGGLHGLYLLVNHAWRAACRRWAGLARAPMPPLVTRSLTFLAVVVAWVFFRADDFHAATVILSAMSGANGISLPHGLGPAIAEFAPWILSTGLHFDGVFTPGVFAGGFSGTVWLAAALLVVWYMPNTQTVMRDAEPALLLPVDPAHAARPIAAALTWKPSITAASLFAIVFAVSVLKLPSISEFIYFHF